MYQVYRIHMCCHADLTSPRDVRRHGAAVQLYSQWNILARISYVQRLWTRTVLPMKSIQRSTAFDSCIAITE